MAATGGLRAVLRALDRRTLLGLALASLAAAIVLVVTRPDPGIETYVAATAIAPRAPLHADDLATRAVGDAEGLVARSELADPGEWMLTSPLAAGEPLLPSLLVPAEVLESPNLLSLAVEEAHAVLGGIVPGDRIDIFVTWPPTGAEPSITEQIAADVLVVDARSGVASFGGAETIELLVAVDDDTAPVLAAGLQRGSLDIVRRAS